MELFGLVLPIGLVDVSFERFELVRSVGGILTIWLLGKPSHCLQFICLVSLLTICLFGG
jgi:hypothetical protein